MSFRVQSKESNLRSETFLIKKFIEIYSKMRLLHIDQRFP